VSAQNVPCQTFSFEPDIYLGSLPAEASSISLKPALDFSFDPQNNTVIILDSMVLDSVMVCYRTISNRLMEPYYSRDISQYASGVVSQLGSASSVPIIPKEEIFSFTDFESYGSITRGVTFGNRQNIFVNSALNLQLDGQLSEDLWVSASITDQNIPYQPEGNTQQIRDFDNVYVKLYNDRFDLTAGDVVLTNPVEEGYFLQYYKNVQGLNLNYKYKLGDSWQARSSFSGSAAKGQFSSALLSPIEGVQGPYRLVGPNGERFIIVMANSERVFIDGELLQRGFDRDYVIDYNLGEITFSNSVVITRFTRIRVDFEYAEQYYSRTNVNVAQEIWSKNLKLYFNFYQEKDNPNGTLGYQLSETDLEALAALNEGERLGRINGVDSVGYLEESVLYAKTDTLINGTLYSILVNSNDPDKAQFRVSFTEVGSGNGDYISQSSTANGRIFRWIEPVEGQSQGNYAPVRIIPLPNKKQMFVLGGKVKLNSFETVNQEFALSNQNLNLYARNGENNTVGYAWRGAVGSQGRSIGKYDFSSQLSLELLNNQFQWIDRFRPVEFDRNWGYTLFQDSLSRADRVLKAEMQLRKDPFNQFKYDFSYRNRTGVVQGSQHEMKLYKNLGPFFSRTTFYSMNNQPGDFDSQWIRFRQDLKLTSWAINPGYIYELDKQKTKRRDSLISSLMHYHLHDFYLETGDTLSTKFRIDAIKRFDQIPIAGTMQSYTEADELRMSLNSRFLSEQTVAVTANYRKVTDKIAKSSDKNLLGKVDWKGSFLNKTVRQNLSFSTANTRELRREFVYILVPTGEGTHTWRDENGDGIQDLNEFYEAINIDERNYAKIFTPTDEYINAYQSTFLHNLDAGFPKRWKSEGTLLRLLSDFSFNSNTRINYKSTGNDVLNRFNPFVQNLESNRVIYARNQRRYGLFYNRNGSGLAFDLNRTNQENKSLLTNGFELRTREDWTSNIRFTLKQGYIIRFNGGLGTTTNESDFLESRNFVLLRHQWAPELIWQPMNTFRVTAKVELREKRQQNSEMVRKSSIRDYSLESTFIQSGKGNLNAQVQWIAINFTGERNTYLGYELLEGLQPGQNQKWNLNWQQSLNRGLQLTLQYNGRKSSGIKPIHTGTMQLTAFF
jgi:hypothetical protein